MPFLSFIFVQGLNTFRKKTCISLNYVDRYISYAVIEYRIACTVFDDVEPIQSLRVHSIVCTFMHTVYDHIMSNAASNLHWAVLMVRVCSLHDVHIQFMVYSSACTQHCVHFYAYSLRPYNVQCSEQPTLGGTYGKSLFIT